MSSNMRFDILVDLDAKAAGEHVDQLRRKLEELSDKHVKAEIDDAEFKAQIREIKGELDALADRHPDVKVRASAARALMDLREVKAEARELDGKRVNIRVDDDGTTSLFTGNTRLLIAAGLAIGPAIAAGVAPGIAALAALGATAGAAVQGAGVLAIAFSGISDGVKELGNEQLATAGKAGQSAAQQISAANSVANAKDSLRSAVQSVAVAEENAALAVRRALQQEESAHLAVEQAVRRHDDAELGLVDAQRSALRAQQDLTQARIDAQRSLEDMAFAVGDNALAQRRAQLELQKARRDLANVAQDDPRRGEAELALEERQQRLHQLEVQGKRLAEDKRKADAAGVEGSRQVTSAQDALTAANKRVTDSQQQITDSVIAVTQAQQRERDAIDEVTRARVSGDRQVAAARQSVIQAERGVQTALASQAAQAAATTADTAKLTKAMDDLSPAGQRFAQFLHDDVIPGLRGIRDEVQASALPDMELALRLLAQGAPAATAGLKGTAAVVGDLSVRGAKMMTSGPWQSDFALIMAANNRALLGWGNAGLSALDVARNLTAAAIPLELHFAGVAEESLAMFAGWLQGKRDSGELAVWFAEMQERLSEIGHFLGQTAGGAWQLIQALAPLGGVTLEIIGDLAQFVGWLSQANPLLVQAIAVTAALYPWVSRLGTAYKFITDLGPALTKATETAALNAGVLTEKWTGSASAGEKVAGGLRSVGAAVPVLGAAVIALSIAYDALVTSADDASAALFKGGAAAAQATADLTAQGKLAESLKVLPDGLTGINEAIDYLLPGMEQATRSFEDQLRAMEPLPRAQALAAKAQNDYADAIEKQDWPRAIAAQREYGAQTAEVTRQQKILKDGLESTTDALRRQQEQVLDLSDADIRYGDALQRATDSVREHGKTTDVSTDAGRRNREAFNDLVRAMAAQEEQMRKSGASEQLLTATHEQHRGKLLEVAGQMSLNQAEAQKLIDKYLGIPRLIDTTFLANTFPAFDQVSRLAGDIAGQLRSIPDESITVAFTAPGSVYGQTKALAQGIPRAMGGPIFGPGTETSDDIPVLASHNEHMWAAAEVRGAGGHGNVIRLRQLAAAGLLPRLATGGPISWSATITPGVEGLADVVARNVAYVREQLAQMAAQAPPAGPAGAGVARWAAMVDQALGIMGQPLSYQGITLRRMNQESGGNPTIVNKWDSNWQKGTPSVGLMQVIGPTYRANRVIDVGPYLYGVSVDPLANTLASMRYAIGRYGSLPAAYNKPGGYANGGIVDRPTMAMVGESGPEVVLPLRRPDRARQLAARAGMGSQVSIGEVHLHDGVDVDLLAQRLAFAQKATGF